jgi:hypothetical protein
MWFCTRRSFNLSFFVLVVFQLVLILNAFSQSATINDVKGDYQQIFGVKYSAAIQYIKQDKWLIDSLKCKNIDPRFALAIVFPELIRYSYLRDFIESNDLKVLYVQFGENYSDFSIGKFQMKPSFAEQLEKDYNRYFTKEEKDSLQIPSFLMINEPAFRKERVKRLDNLYGQLRYLQLFFLIMQKRYNQLNFSSQSEKMKFYSTAYNLGYMKGVDYIMKGYNRKQFHTEIVMPSKLYNYSEISLFFYNHYPFQQ